MFLCLLPLCRDILDMILGIQHQQKDALLATQARARVPARSRPRLPRSPPEPRPLISLVLPINTALPSAGDAHPAEQDARHGPGPATRGEGGAREAHLRARSNERRARLLVREGHTLSSPPLYPREKLTGALPLRYLWKLPLRGSCERCSVVLGGDCRLMENEGRVPEAVDVDAAFQVRFFVPRSNSPLTFLRGALFPLCLKMPRWLRWGTRKLTSVKQSGDQSEWLTRHLHLLALRRRRRRWGGSCSRTQPTTPRSRTRSTASSAPSTCAVETSSKLDHTFTSYETNGEGLAPLSEVMARSALDLRRRGRSGSTCTSAS